VRYDADDRAGRGELAKIGAVVIDLAELTAGAVTRAMRYAAHCVMRAVEDSYTHVATLVAKNSAQVKYQRLVVPRTSGDKACQRTRRLRHRSFLAHLKEGGANILDVLKAFAKSHPREFRAAARSKAGCSALILRLDLDTSMALVADANLPLAAVRLINKFCLAKMGRPLFAVENEVRAEQRALALPREFGTDKFQTKDGSKLETHTFFRVTNLASAVDRDLSELGDYFVERNLGGSLADYAVVVTWSADGGGGSFKWGLQLKNTLKPVSVDTWTMCLEMSAPDNWFNIDRACGTLNDQLSSWQGAFCPSAYVIRPECTVLRTAFAV